MSTVLQNDTINQAANISIINYENQKELKNKEKKDKRN
jgi:hypothetical protein